MPMNRFQAMALIMARLTADNRLKPATVKYKLARKLATELIDLIGPAAAVKQIGDADVNTLDHLERVCIQFRIESNFPSLSL